MQNGYTLLDAGIHLINKWQSLSDYDKEKFRASAKELNT